MSEVVESDRPCNMLDCQERAMWGSIFCEDHHKQTVDPDENHDMEDFVRYSMREEELADFDDCSGG